MFCRPKAWRCARSVLEQLGQKSGAIAAYQEILKLNAPVERQRQAILKMAELAIALDRFSDAEDSLREISGAIPRFGGGGRGVADARRIAFEGLHAWRHRFAGGDEPFAGGAGAFRPISGRVHEQSARRQGVSGPRLVFVARGENHRKPRDFQSRRADNCRRRKTWPWRGSKWATRCSRRKISRARWKITARWWMISRIFPPWRKRSATARFTRSLRANLELKDVAGASNAMARILKLYPASDLADSSLLLVGEGLADSRQPAAARALFQKIRGAVSQFAVAAAGGTGRRAHLRTGTELARGHRPIRKLAERFSDQRAAAAGGLRAGAGEFSGGQRDERVRVVHEFRRAVSDERPRALAQWWVADHFFRGGRIT